jgi:hypothetical protein
MFLRVDLNEKCSATRKNSKLIKLISTELQAFKDHSNNSKCMVTARDTFTQAHINSLIFAIFESTPLC